MRQGRVVDRELMVREGPRHVIFELSIEHETRSRVDAFRRDLEIHHET
jgi:hypothetical protein